MPLPIENIPERYAMANELHSRPFPTLTAPCQALHIAIMRPAGMEQDFRDHLLALLDRFGAQHPAAEARYYSGQVGRALLKWEMHTEFTTYTLFTEGLSEPPFGDQLFESFPTDWLKEVPGKLVSSIIIRVEQIESDALAGFISQHLPQWFNPESLAVASVNDGTAVVASDFRLDENGHSRFVVLANGEAGPRRLGRIVQRLLEIETYKSMSMLTLSVARDVNAQLASIEHELSALVENMSSTVADNATKTLDKLLHLSAQIEVLSAASTFRFSAATAYSALVNQRINILRETRISNKQLFSEFMVRRYEPAIRNCRVAEDRMRDISIRAERAANLLRTRVDVAMSNQNNELLHRMEQRAALQMRLQETVEGLSVVAISYYGVSLATYLFAPGAEALTLSDTYLSAFLTVPVVLAVWLMVRRIRRRASRTSEK